MNRLVVFLITCTLVLSATACSVVFTGSITGTLADETEYENGDAGSGITDAAVYLYTEEINRDTDLAAWNADNTVFPDNPEGGVPGYFLKTITDDQGAYTFNGFIWNELFPEYGKSGDRKEVFLLFYHKRYGLTKNPYPVYVVSDVTNRIPVFTLSRIMNTAEISGTLVDKSTGEALPNAGVSIWVPESWSYLSDGSIDTDESSDAKFTWGDNPSYTALTDELGEWQQEISYRMLPSVAENLGTVVVRLNFSASGYIAENSADAEIIDGGWDRDANGSIENDEDDGYQQSGEISSGSYTDLGEIGLSDELNTAVVSGRLVNSNTSEGESNVTVQIFTAEDWEYTSADPESIEAASDVDWPENPSYTLTTDLNGDFSQSIEFERKPSGSDNRETTRVRMVFIKDNYRINSSSDPLLTDGGWDRDGNGTIDADEDDAYYDPADVIRADLDNDTGTISVKQIDFSESLSGEVWNSLGTDLVNGVEVWLFYGPVDHDADPSTPMQTPQPSDLAYPDYVDTTTTVLISQDTAEKGHFSFNGLEWTDESYSGNQSRVSYYVYLPTIAERASGRFDVANLAELENGFLTAGASNEVSLQQN